MLLPIIQPNTEEHQQKLHSFGLSLDSFVEIGTRILAAFNQTTPNDAANAAGTYAYLAAVRAMRDVLGPFGWEPYKKLNLEMVKPPSERFFIIPSSGDKYTGFDGIEPKTRNPKGNQTKELVARNRMNRNQASLFPEMEPVIPVFDPETVPTWFLLYHIDRHEMRMELALPVNIDIDDLRVDQWRERIILEAIKFDHTPMPPTFVPDFTPEFDIEIRRKINE